MPAKSILDIINGGFAYPNGVPIILGDWVLFGLKKLNNWLNYDDIDAFSRAFLNW